MAISLSLLCAIHCLALPLIIVLLPSLSALNLDDESYHRWMLMAVIPISIYALSMGCKKHKRFQLLIWGITGLLLLITAVAMGESLIGQFYEKILTLLGVSIIAVGHYLNFRLCQVQQKCLGSECHNH